MSVPFYYNDGPGASAQMKRDVQRVRLAKPHRYVSHKVKEQRMSEDGNSITVTINAEPTAAPMSARARHAMFVGKTR
jgi:hypothetical protein